MTLNLIAENQLLRWLVGDAPDRAGTPQLQWSNLPESWGVFLFILAFVAIVASVIYLYLRELNTCPMPVKLVMAAVRLSVVLLILLLMLRPSVVFQQVNEIKPTVPVLLDGSLSFNQGDNYRSRDQAKQLAQLTGLPADDISNRLISRADLVNQAFKKNPQLLDKLRDKGALRVVNFSDGATPIALIPATNQKTDQPENESPSTDSTGNKDELSVDAAEAEDSLIRDSMPTIDAQGLGTDIWQALRESLDDASRLSSIVLITDGQHNGGEDPLEIAKKAASLGIPIFVIGAGDPNPPKDIAVTEVYVREKAYPDEPFEVEAILQSTQVGDEGIPSKINVQLVQQLVDSKTGKMGPSQRIKSKQISVPENGGRMRVDFGHVINQPGSYVYTVEIEELTGETNVDNNALTSSEIEIVDEQVKVLLVSGLPSWDYQQVQRLLQRDSTISLSCWLQSMDETRPQEGDAPISRLPRSIEELGKYNVVLMMDPNPEEFDEGWMDLLRDFCKFKAGGVLFMAGPQFSSEFVTMNRLRSIRDLLPVRLGDNEFINTVEALSSARENTAGKMLVVNHNLDHPVMSFRSDPVETQRIWELMPGIFWSFPTIAPKPTSRVLLERGDQVNAEGNQPLMVAGRFGAGSVLYMGFQGTWRWRPVGVQAQYFDRFWIQVVRYLVENRSLQGSRRGFIDTEKTEFELGERVLLVGRVLDGQFKPSTQPIHKAIIRSQDGRSQTVEMKLLPNQSGSYEGTFIAQRIGSFEATIQLGGEGDQTLIDPIKFRITAPSAESGATWLNEKLLTEIARLSDGKYFRLEQLPQVPEALPTLVTRAEFKSRPEPLWDSNPYLRWIVFGLPVLLLTIEWILRKWYKLL